MKKCNNTKTKRMANKRRSSANGSNTSTVGAVTSLILMLKNKYRIFTIPSFLLLGLIATLASGLINVDSTYAAMGTISINISSDKLGLSVFPQTANGTFASSDNVSISVTTDNSQGYTLSIASTNSTNLIGYNNSSNVLSSISSPTSEADFSADTQAAATNYNGKWGYLPSKFNSVSNTDYRPAPNTTGDVLGTTNTSNSTANQYTISIGARVGQNTPNDSYSNTFVIAAIANFTCNPNATTITEAMCMQDMNDSVANSMEVNRQYILTDNRDNKDYYIAKMKDGRVWMTQNLDLDLETTPNKVAALTSNNTDLNEAGSGAYADGYTTSGGVIT